MASGNSRGRVLIDPVVLGSSELSAVCHEQGSSKDYGHKYRKQQDEYTSRSGGNKGQRQPRDDQPGADQLVWSAPSNIVGMVGPKMDQKLFLKNVARTRTSSRRETWGVRRYPLTAN